MTIMNPSRQSGNPKRPSGSGGKTAHVFRLTKFKISIPPSVIGYIHSGC